MKINIFWCRRDMRLDDNAALYHALKSEFPVLPVFILDKEILNKLEDKKDSRVTFIIETLQQMQEQLVANGSSLKVLNSTPVVAFSELVKEYKIDSVFTNTDYEPYAKERDEKIETFLQSQGIKLKQYKDHVIFEKNEVIKDDGKPYTVFTPYSKKWKAVLNDDKFISLPSDKYFSNFCKTKPLPIPTLHDISFEKSDVEFPTKNIEAELVKKYAEQRNFPAISGTSRLGLHLRFGTISVRKLAQYAQPKSETFLNELIWRDFYQMILWHFPHVGEGKSFKPAYDNIKWLDDENGFNKWCEGNTGYPIVDAGMRELNTTGFMHNRVRMIVASFLCKHLLIDWRLGESYFAGKLLDFDFASNNGGWQWASGSGCDSAPYFRIFNPYLQTQKFDPDLKYIKKWVPEFQELTYPKPIVEHTFARDRCLKVYKEGLAVGS